MPVAVASHSFPKHHALRQELTARYPNAVFNETGQPLRGADLVRFLRGHDKAITGLEVLDAALFAAVPEVRVVSKYGVGLDMIDLEAARRGGVSVRWTPGVNRQSVAELTIAFMIALCRRIVPLATAYFPHCPAGKSAPFQTRRFRGALFRLLALDHLYHLEHHLYPAVPHQNWPALARRLNPYLDALEVPVVRLRVEARKP